MSEKRFSFGAVSPNVAMIKDNGEPMDIGEVVDKLNEQQFIIEQLERKLELKTEEVEYLKRMMVKWGMIEDE